jgi:hypothetical protein
LYRAFIVEHRIKPECLARRSAQDPSLLYNKAAFMSGA